MDLGAPFLFLCVWCTFCMRTTSYAYKLTTMLLLLLLLVKYKRC